MARWVKVERCSPYRVEVGDEILFICGCGLSREMPYCDRSHKFCWHEDPEKIYVYDERLHATEVESE